MLRNAIPTFLFGDRLFAQMHLLQEPIEAARTTAC
jgi:hypothetical protein